MTLPSLPYRDPSLVPLLDPATVAVVGASPDFTRYGGRVWKFINQVGFTGEIYAVNPKYAEIGGVRCYPSLAALPKRPDHVGVAIGAGAILPLLGECAELGIKAVTVFSAGFAERGDAASIAHQQRLTDFARRAGIRVLGPNCNGLLNWKSRLAMGATATALEPMARPGCVGVVSQSGGVGQVNVMWRAIRAGLGISYQVACGNEADVDTLDIANFMVDDPGTTVILMAIEGIRDGAKLRAVAEKAAEAAKPILIYKVGRSAGGQAAAASHTGAMTGVDAVHDAVMAELGIIRVEDTEHLHEAAMLFAQGRKVTAPGLSATSVSGGCVAIIADLAERFGLSFPAYSAETTAALAKIIPGFLTVANPTDLSVELQGNDRLNDVMEIIGRDAGVGINLPILTMAPKRDLDAMVAFGKASPKPAAIIWTGGCNDAPLPEIDHVHDGIPIYRDVDTALRAAGAVVRHAAFLEKRLKRQPPVRPAGIDQAAARRLLAAATDHVLTERQSKAVLAAYGLPVTREALADSADAAVALFRETGRPVAMKIESADIPHKTDIGGVRLGVADEAGVREAFGAIMAAAAAAHPQAMLNGVLVQEMAGQGIELILGMSTDPTYGPVLALGVGGIFAELIGKPVLRLPPLGEAEALDMIAAMPGAKLLDGVRGRPAGDRKRLADAICRFSWLVGDLGDAIAEIDINPLILGPDWALAVDALIVRK